MPGYGSTSWYTRPAPRPGTTPGAYGLSPHTPLAQHPHRPHTASAAPTPGAPAAPAAPGDVLPPATSPELLAAQAAANQNIALGNATDTWQIGQLRNDYGYDASGNVDPSNPYSQAALLQKHYQQSQRGNLNSYADRGQLYSGALQNAQDAAYGSFKQGEYGLKRDLNNQLGQIAIGGLQRYGQYGATLDGQRIADLLRQLGIGG